MLSYPLKSWETHQIFGRSVDLTVFLGSLNQKEVSFLLELVILRDVDDSFQFIEVIFKTVSCQIKCINLLSGAWLLFLQYSRDAQHVFVSHSTYFAPACAKYLEKTFCTNNLNSSIIILPTPRTLQMSALLNQSLSVTPQGLCVNVW